jgi:hypothetical protein
MYPLILTIALAGSPCIGPTCPCNQPPAIVTPATCEPVAPAGEETYDGRRHRIGHILKGVGRAVGHLRPFHRRGRRG